MAIDLSRLNSSNTAATTSSRSATATDNATASSAKSAQGTVQTATVSGETVSLSSEAQQLQQITEKLNDQPVVNSARVAELKEAIANGSYKVDSDRVASKILNFEADA